jgi:hypothetical protein
LCRREDFLDTPQCDIALPELRVAQAAGVGVRADEVRPAVLGQLSVELAAGVPSVVQWPNSEFGEGGDVARDQSRQGRIESQALPDLYAFSKEVSDLADVAEMLGSRARAVLRRLQKAMPPELSDSRRRSPKRK